MNKYTGYYCWLYSTDNLTAILEAQLSAILIQINKL